MRHLLIAYDVYRLVFGRLNVALLFGLSTEKREVSRAKNTFVRNVPQHMKHLPLRKDMYAHGNVCSMHSYGLAILQPLPPIRELIACHPMIVNAIFIHIKSFPIMHLSPDTAVIFACSASGLLITCWLLLRQQFSVHKISNMKAPR